jgi:hypothetical protein
MPAVSTSAVAFRYRFPKSTYVAAAGSMVAMLSIEVLGYSMLIRRLGINERIAYLKDQVGYDASFLGAQ